MSKAFVKDDDGEEDETPSAPAPSPAGPNYMTTRGHAEMRREFERLVKVERPELVQVVSWAAGNGDRSENGDYIYGKKRLREIDRRIRYLMKRLESAVVVDPAAQENAEQVFFGATVTLAFSDEAEGPATYQIVGIDEADAGQGRISWVSPLARALMKAREGEVILLRSPAGAREMEVVAIRYE